MQKGPFVDFVAADDKKATLLSRLATPALSKGNILA
jgi:hypothetical protein